MLSRAARTTGRALLALIFLMAAAHAGAVDTVGTWRFREGQLEVVLTLEPSGTATWQATKLLILFAETTDGECIAHTTREELPPVSGTYRVQDDRLTFRWDTPPEPPELFPIKDGEAVWPFLLAGNELQIALPDRQLVLRRPQS